MSPSTVSDAWAAGSVTASPTFPVSVCSLTVMTGFSLLTSGSFGFEQPTETRNIPPRNTVISVNRIVLNFFIIHYPLFCDFVFFRNGKIS